MVQQHNVHTEHFGLLNNVHSCIQTPHVHVVRNGGRGGAGDGLAERKRELLGFGKVLIGKLPVDDVPPGLEVLGAGVAVVDVVGVLPDVTGEEGG